MSETTARRVSSPASAALQIAILVLIGSVVFFQEIGGIVRVAVRDPERAHVLAVPVLIALLLWLRRRAIAEEMRPGSLWGAVFAGVGLIIFAVCSWPFNYGLGRRYAFIPVIAGIILSICGWKVLSRTVAILLLLLIAIPLGPRLHARVTRQPELMTLKATALILEATPRIDLIEMSGPEMTYSYGAERGTIALGEPHRWMGLVYAYITIGIFVAYASIRPAWQTAVILLATVPVALACNLVRVLIWGLLTVYGGVVPSSPVPRTVAAWVTLPLAYILIVIVAAVVSRLVTTDPVKEPSGGTS
jgi:hypothetical protein